jgi:phosphoribosylformimino-5-aminoimidazole carboxamide ribotide isomerase
MPIVPVIDLLNGQVVRGVAGRRAEYRPIQSRLVPGAAPADVARAFRDRFGFTALYLADLDAIAGRAPATAVYRDLHQLGFRLWVDAGIHGADDAAALVAAGVHSVVAGLETVAGPQAVGQLCDRLGPDRVVFSLDLKGGQPLTRPGLWPGDPWDIALNAIGRGVRRLLVLDLARVGVGEGVGTEALCARLRRHDAGLEITAGGGVRGVEDVERLHACGVDYVLVASDLHDGRIAPDP